jgi:hypothetical protein
MAWATAARVARVSLSGLSITKSCVMPSFATARRNSLRPGELHDGSAVGLGRGGACCGARILFAGRHQPRRSRPPLTTSRWPVMNPASSDAKKLTAWAMSSRRPIRPAGTEAR